MPKKDIIKRVGACSERVQRLAYADTCAGQQSLVRALDGDDVKALRALAADPEAEKTLRLDRILLALSDAGPDDQVRDLAGSLLEAKGSRRTGVRAAAALALARVPGEETDSILMAHARDKDPIVARRSVQSLGQVAGPDVLADLRALRLPDIPFLQRQRTFSTHLLECRHGIRAERPPKRVGTHFPTQRGRRIARLPVDRLEGRELAQVLEDLDRLTYGVGLAKNLGVSMEFDRITSYLLPSARVGSAKTRRELAERPAVAAFVGYFEERVKTVLPDLTILTYPDDRILLVQGYRADGELILEGEARVTEDGAAFQVANVERPGQCRFRVTGKITDGDLAVEVASAGRTKPASVLEFRG
mgnify:FL=1